MGVEMLELSKPNIEDLANRDRELYARYEWRQDTSRSTLASLL